MESGAGEGEGVVPCPGTFPLETESSSSVKRGYLLANACTEEPSQLAQFASGQSGVGWKEGTFKDAEDGLLSGNPIAQGFVDSVVAVHLNLDGLSKKKADYWRLWAHKETPALDHLPEKLGVNGCTQSMNVRKPHRG